MPIVAPRSPGGLLRRRAGGGADRADLPHAGAPAVRRLPGQRLRAVADPGRRRAARPARGVRHRAQRPGRPAEFWPYLRDPRDAGPPVGRPRHARAASTASAAWRRPTARGNISYDPDNHDLMVRLRAGQGRRHRTCRTSRSTTRPATPSVLVLGWGSTYGPIGAGCPPGAQARATRSRRPTCATSTRSRRTSARCCARYDRVAGAGDEPRPAGPAAAREVPRRRAWATPRSRACRSRRRSCGRVHRTSISRTGVHAMTARSRPGAPGDRRPATASPRPTTKQTAKDFKSDQEVRWCPGCGDYAVLAAVQSFLPELGLKRENIVFVSGIGCSLAVPVLHEHLRDALDPRPRAGDRHRPGRHAAGPVGVGGHR